MDDLRQTKENNSNNSKLLREILLSINEIKGDIKEIKSDIKEIQSDIKEIKSNIKSISNNIDKLSDKIKKDTISRSIYHENYIRNMQIPQSIKQYSSNKLYAYI